MIAYFVLLILRDMCLRKNKPSMAHKTLNVVAGQEDALLEKLIDALVKSLLKGQFSKKYLIK